MQVDFNGDLDSAGECSDLCLETPGCEYWTYDSDGDNCVELEDCQEVDTSCQTCVSGPRGCGKSNQAAIKKKKKKDNQFVF